MQGTFSLFPSSPARFLFFRLLLFFLGIPSRNLCGGERLATMSLEFEHHLQFPFGSLSTGLSDIRQSAQECKQISKKTRTKSNDVIAVISAYQHFASTFSMQIFKIQRHSCKLSFLFLPCQQSTPESLFTRYTLLGTSPPYITSEAVIK